MQAVDRSDAFVEQMVGDEVGDHRVAHDVPQGCQFGPVRVVEHGGVVEEATFVGIERRDQSGGGRCPDPLSGDRHQLVDDARPGAARRSRRHHQRRRMSVGERHQIVRARSTVRPPGTDHSACGRRIEAQRLTVDLADRIGMAEAVDRERNVRACDEHDPQFRRSPPDQRFDHADRPGGAVETFHLVDHDRQRLADAGGEGVGDQGAQLLGALDRIGTDSRTRRRPEGDRQLGRHLGHPDPELPDKASGELETVAVVPTRQPDPREVVGHRSHNRRLATPGCGRHDGERSGRRGRFAHHPGLAVAVAG